MKKMFAKLEMPSILSLVFLLGGLLFGTSASAQTTLGGGQQNSSPIKTNGTWKSAGDAIAALQAEIDYLDQILPTNPGNGAELKMRYTIYKEIVVAIGDGQAVANAAYDSYKKYAPISGMDSHPTTPGISQNAWLTMYTDMVNLLLI